MTTNAESEHGISDEDALAIFESGEGFDFEHPEYTPLGEIYLAHEAVTAAEELLNRAVHAGKASGLSWEQISVVLGMSRQGARQHYMPLMLEAGPLAVPVLNLDALKDLNILVTNLRSCMIHHPEPEIVQPPVKQSASKVLTEGRDRKAKRR